MEYDESELTITVSDELVHEVSLLGEHALEKQTEQEAIDRLTSIGGIIYSVKLGESKLSICFSHDPLTALKSLHEVVTHRMLRGINLKENLRRITIQGNGLERFRSRARELLGEPRVHFAQIDPSMIILTVEQSALDEIESLF